MIAISAEADQRQWLYWRLRVFASLAAGALEMSSNVNPALQKDDEQRDEQRQHDVNDDDHDSGETGKLTREFEREWEREHW